MSDQIVGSVAFESAPLALEPARPLSLTEREAAEIIRVSPRTLARWRIVGGGPRYRRHGTEPLYTINPFDERGLAALFATHPPVGERVTRLRSLDPEWRDKLRAA